MSIDVAKPMTLGPLEIPLPQSSVLDLGCGPNKVPGAFGVDIHPYPGVDQVVDVNQVPWPIANDSFDFIVVRHVIEHVDNLVGFMRELHRIARPNGKIYFETPHFSSINSWNDPTHLRHLSSRWHELFSDSGYLSAQTGQFHCLRSTVTFGKSWRNRLGRLISRVRGLEKWEKNSAFIFPGMDVVTLLQAEKNQQ